MTLIVKHAFVSGKGDGPDATKVQASHWDASHVISDSITGLPIGTGTLVPVGVIMDYAGITAPTGWLECAGQLVAIAAYPALHAALVKSSVVDITIGSPAVVTWAAHGLAVGSVVRFNTTGALPTGITVSTKYYVLSAGYTAGSFRVSLTFEGTAVITSGTQSGVHTATYGPFGVSGTNFNIPDLRERVTAGASVMAGSAVGTLIAANYGVGDIAGEDDLILAAANLPAHAHTVDPPSTNTTSDAHTHTFSDTSSTVSGSTGLANLTHTHDWSVEYWNNAQGEGGHSALQPDWQSGADGGFTKATTINTGNLNHSHTFSGTVAVSGTTSSDSHFHTVNIGSFNTGNGPGTATPISLLQPMIFVRKIIYAGV